MKNIHFKIVLFTACIMCFNGMSAPGYTQITTPEKYLGYKPGSDFHLSTYEDLIGYFELLSSQSDRIQLFDMGQTSEGRRMKYAIISSPQNMANLEQFKEISRKLSLTHNISDDDAKNLAEKGKVVIWIDSGIHSTETSPPMHQFMLVYDLVSGNDKQTDFILDNVILLLVLANPDGMTMVANWYNDHVGTPYEVSPPPFLYHKYAGHDNNRDAFIANLVETQNMERIIGCEWYPQLMYTQHEAAPFPARIWIPPNPEPVNPNIHPMITRWKNLIGSAMGQVFESADQSGAISRIAYDLWYPGYTDGPSVEGHNIPSILTETANFRYATPHFYTIDDFPEAYQDLVAGTFYPSPWQGGWWRFHDAVNYDLTASKAVLQIAARYREEFLLQKFKMGCDVIERFKKEPPYGWIISAKQTDPNTTALFLNRLMNYGIEIYETTESFTYTGQVYPAGSYIIFTSQPFGLFVKNVFETQQYPDLRKYGHLWQGIARIKKWNGEPLAPYDGVGWTLPLQMGIQANELYDPISANMKPVDHAILLEGEITGKGRYALFSSSSNNSYLAVNQAIQAGGQVFCSTEQVVKNGKNYPAGSFLITINSIRRSKISQIAADTQIPMIATNYSGKLLSLKKSRIALYCSWVPCMDGGWISYVFDLYQFPFTKIRDADIKTGNLNSRFDVIIVPDQNMDAIVKGHRKGKMPPQYINGLTQQGVDNLKKFVAEGGTLICNNHSCELAVKSFNLQITNVVKDVKPDSFLCPGSLLKIVFEANNPMTFGLQKNGVAYFSHSSAFAIDSDTLHSAPKIIAHFPNERLLRSGWIIGEEIIQNKAAILEVAYHKGKIILFGFNIINRAQSYANFKLMFNAVYQYDKN